MKEQLLARHRKAPTVFFEIRELGEQPVAENEVRVGAFALNLVDLKTQSAEPRFAPPAHGKIGVLIRGQHVHAVNVG